MKFYEGVVIVVDFMNYCCMLKWWCCGVFLSCLEWYLEIFEKLGVISLVEGYGDGS